MLTAADKQASRPSTADRHAKGLRVAGVLCDFRAYFLKQILNFVLGRIAA